MSSRDISTASCSIQTLPLLTDESAPLLPQSSSIQKAVEACLSPPKEASLNHSTWRFWAKHTVQYIGGTAALLTSFWPFALVSINVFKDDPSKLAFIGAVLALAANVPQVGGIACYGAMGLAVLLFGAATDEDAARERENLHPVWKGALITAALCVGLYAQYPLMGMAQTELNGQWEAEAVGWISMLGNLPISWWSTAILFLSIHYSCKDWLPRAGSHEGRVIKSQMLEQLQLVKEELSRGTLSPDDLATHPQLSSELIKLRDTALLHKPYLLEAAHELISFVLGAGYCAYMSPFAAEAGEKLFNAKGAEKEVVEAASYGLTFAAWIYFATMACYRTLGSLGALAQDGFCCPRTKTAAEHMAPVAMRVGKLVNLVLGNLTFYQTYLLAKKGAGSIEGLQQTIIAVELTSMVGQIYEVQETLLEYLVYAWKKRSSPSLVGRIRDLDEVERIFKTSNPQQFKEYRLTLSNEIV